MCNINITKPNGFRQSKGLHHNHIADTCHLLLLIPSLHHKFNRLSLMLLHTDCTEEHIALTQMLLSAALPGHVRGIATSSTPLAGWLAGCWPIQPQPHPHPRQDGSMTCSPTISSPFAPAHLSHKQPAAISYLQHNTRTTHTHTSLEPPWQPTSGESLTV